MSSLASLAVGERFGQAAQTVYEFLEPRSTSTVQDLLQSLDLKRSSIHHILLDLSRHNVVQYLETPGKPSSICALKANAERLVRLGMYASCIARNYDPDAAKIMAIFLRSPNLSLPELFDKLRSDYKAGYDPTLADWEEDYQRTKLPNYQHQLYILIRNRLLMRVYYKDATKITGSYAGLSADEDATSKESKQSLRAMCFVIPQKIKAFAKPPPIGQQQQQQHTVPAKNSSESATLGMDDMIGLCPQTLRTKLFESITNTQPTDTVSAAAHASTLSPDEDYEQYFWTFNADQLDAALLTHLLCEYFRDQYDTVSMAILLIILLNAELRAAYSTVGTQTYTEAMPKHRILPVLQSVLFASDTTLNQALTFLCTDGANIYNPDLTTPSRGVLLKVDASGGGRYAINLTKAIQTLQMSIIESSAREEFGTEGVRILRLICTSGYIEQDQVAELALVPKKTSNSKLMGLFRAKLVSMQEVSRHGATFVNRDPKRLAYLFSFNLPNVAAHFRETIKFAMKNILARKSVERERGAATLKIIERKLGAEVTDLSLDLSGAKLTELELATIAELRACIEKLASALIVLDKNLLIFTVLDLLSDPD